MIYTNSLDSINNVDLVQIRFAARWTIFKTLRWVYLPSHHPKFADPTLVFSAFQIASHIPLVSFSFCSMSVEWYDLYSHDRTWKSFSIYNVPLYPLCDAIIALSSLDPVDLYLTC